MTQYGPPSLAQVAPAHVGCVWVVSRHLLVAQALAAALTRRVADVRALPWTAEALEEAPIHPLEDVMLVVDDVRTPAAMAAVRALLAQAPVRALVMTAAPRGHVWGALLDAGASEVIPEVESVELLTGLIEDVCAGQPVVPYDERAALVEAWESHLAEEEELAHRMSTLSPREVTVLDHLAAGRRSAEIGRVLGVTESTVRTHVRSIRRKLGVDSQLRAVLVVHRLRGRVPPLALAMPSPRRARE